MNLKGAKALITGGSSGIGKATAVALKEAGAEVAITGRSAAKVAAVAKELGVLGIQADVSKAEDITRTYSEFLSAFGSIDILINNAGIGGFASLLEIEPAQMENIWRTNVLGATMMAQEAAKHFKEQASGNIVNIASTAGLRGYAKGSMYSSTKFAVRSLSECWRAELRPYNIRVSTVCPSEVTTAFAQEDRVEKEEESNKLRSEEIAHAILSVLEMDDRGFIPELVVHATNPF